MSSDLQGSSDLRHIRVPEQVPSSGLFHASGELRHRLADVLRARPGERLILRNASGPIAVAEVCGVARAAVSLTILGPAPPVPTPRLHVTVAQALGKGDRFEQVLQHGVELGVSAFVPLITARTVKRPSDRDVGAKMARWSKILDAAAEQARREATPTLCEPCSLGEALARIPQVAIACTLRPGAPLGLHQLAAGLAIQPVVLFVGPEGGFDDDEYRSLVEVGAISASLGPYVLRTETAALAAVTVLLWSRAGD